MNLGQPKGTCSEYSRYLLSCSCLLSCSLGHWWVALRLSFTGCCAALCVVAVVISVLCVVLCGVALRCSYVALPCPALPAPWLAKMHSALQLCYHRARRRFNASNCRMCMRGRKRRCWGCKWELLKLEIKRKRKVKMCVCGRARHRDSQQRASQVGVEIHDANASCDSFG